MPPVGAMIGQSDKFAPVSLRALQIRPNEPLVFDFIVDSGNSGLQGEALKKEIEKLTKYFLATITIPEKDLWVNLSPYEKNRIIPNELGLTEMGRDLLSQDYVLKQLAASLVHPESDMGKDFWRQIYAQAEQELGTTEIPMDSFNKVWIMPDTATIYEVDNTAVLGATHLKVMMEEDYLALKESSQDALQGRDVDSAEVNKVSSDIMRRLVLPAIEKEVNEGKNFAMLRQIYNAMILATWYKEALKDGLLAQVYANQKKVAGVDTADKNIREKIFAQYVASYKEGVFNMIREDADPVSGEIIPRKYFSGGYDGAQTVTVINKGRTPVARLAQVPGDSAKGIGDFSQVTVAVVKAAFTKDFAMANKLTALIQDPVVGSMAKNFLEDLKFHQELTPFYSRITGVSPEEINKNLIDETYNEYGNELETISANITEGRTFPKDASKIRTSVNIPEQPAFKVGNRDEVQVLLWPMKGDPWQSGHVWMLLEAMSKFNMDIAIPTIDDTDPTRKPGLSSLAMREALTTIMYEKLLGGLVKETPLMKEVPELLTKEGERVLFSVLALNPNQKIRLRYGAGSDHGGLFYHRKIALNASNYQDVLNDYGFIKTPEEQAKVIELLTEKGFMKDGRTVADKFEDLIVLLKNKGYLLENGTPNKSKVVSYGLGEHSSDLKIEDLKELGLNNESLKDFVYQVFFAQDVSVGIALYMFHNTEGYRERAAPAAIDVVFSQRKGEEVAPDVLKQYEDYVNVRLERNGLPRMSLDTITQPLNVSSTQIREQGYGWKMPFSVMQIAEAFGMWSYQRQGMLGPQITMANELYEQNIKPYIEAGSGEDNINAIKKVVDKFDGIGMDALEKKVVPQLIGLREGTMGMHLTVEYKERAIQYLNNIRQLIFNHARVLAQKALTNPLPIRQTDEPILAEMLESGKNKLPTKVSEYLSDRREKGLSMEVKDISYESGLSEELVSSLLKADAASSGQGKDNAEAVIKTQDKLGGIDLDPAMMNMNIERRGGRIQVNMDPAEIQRIKDGGVTGFRPVIIDIHSIPAGGMIPALSEGLIRDDRKAAKSG